MKLVLEEDNIKSSLKTIKLGASPVITLNTNEEITLGERLEELNYLNELKLEEKEFENDEEKNQDKLLIFKLNESADEEKIKNNKKDNYFKKVGNYIFEFDLNNNIIDGLECKLNEKGKNNNNNNNDNPLSLPSTHENNNNNENRLPEELLLKKSKDNNNNNNNNDNLCKIANFNSKNN